MMKCFLCLAVTLMSLAGFAQPGGFSIHLDMEQSSFISNEDVVLIVRVTNRSGETVELGRDNAWLSFEVENASGLISARSREVPVEGVFVLPSSKTATKKVNLTPYFNFRDPGRYQVTALLKVPGYEKPLVSKPKAFDIFTGTKLLEIEVGVPKEFLGKNAQPEVRQYILQQANYLKHLKLYFRLTDGSGANTLKVFPLSNLVSFSKPEAQVDQFSNFHVLVQVGARSFSYFMLNPDGQLLLRQTHEYGETRPVLKLEAGRVFVRGGMQRISATDLPPPSNDVTNRN